jgi:hypothetical protein
MANKTWREFLPYFMEEVGGCPRPTAERIVKRVLIHFLENSLILEKEANKIYMTENEGQYDISFSVDKYRPIAIVRARWGEYPDDIPEGNFLDISHWDEMDSVYGQQWDMETTSNLPSTVILNFDNTLQVYPIPTESSDDELNLRCAVTLLQSSTSVDEFIFENFVEDIAKGCLAELLKQPGKTWTDRDIALDYERDYWDGIRAARKQSTGGKGETSGRVRPRSFIFHGHAQ